MVFSLLAKHPWSLLWRRGWRVVSWIPQSNASCFELSRPLLVCSLHLLFSATTALLLMKLCLLTRSRASRLPLGSVSAELLIALIDEPGKLQLTNLLNRLHAGVFASRPELSGQLTATGSRSALSTQLPFQLAYITTDVPRPRPARAEVMFAGDKHSFSIHRSNG